MLVHAYAHILAEAEAKKLGKPFADSLIAYMKAKGHVSLLPRIMKILVRMPHTDRAIVTVAKHADLQKYKHEISVALKQVSAEAHETVEDANMVGGYSVRAHGKVVDKSFRTALVGLYKNITRS